MSEFRVTVVLNQFFSDYRSIARLFVHKEITTIGDLTKYICDRFGIESNVYLTSNNVYLPDTEDVRVLKEDDVICANANHKSLQKDFGHDIEVKTLEEQVIGKKAKRKRLKHENMRSVGVQAFSNKNNETSIEQGPKTLNFLDVLPFADHELNSEKPSKKEIKKALKKARREANNASENYSQIEKDKNSELSIETPPAVNLKKNTHIPTNGLSPYSAISNFKVPRKRPIKLMEISTIPKIIKPVYVHDTPVMTNVLETNETTVTSSSLTILKNIVTDQPLENKIIAGDESISITSENRSLEHGKNISSETVSKNIREWYPKSETYAENTNLSRLQQAKQLLLQQIKAKFDNLTQINNKSITSTPNSFNSDNTSDLEDSKNLTDCQKYDTEDTSADFAMQPKRKRIRKRPKRNKKLHTDVNITPYAKVDLPVSSPRNPATHVRFDDATPNQVEDAVGNTTAMSNYHSKINKNEELPSNLQIVLKDPLQTDDILKYPVLSNTLLKEGDIVAFKMLVMSQSYTPKISDYVIGRILSYNPITDNLLVKILEGSEQCRFPEGKFLLKEDAVQIESETRELRLDQLLEPRLLYP